MNPSSNENNSSENNRNPRRKGKGRQKINLAKIENETNLQVTFSKRRAGLFKKASELSTLCGAESAVVIFSPGGKPHSFGNPSVNTVVDRFLNPNPNQINEAAHNLQGEAHGNPLMDHRGQEIGRVEARLKQEKERRKELENLRKAPESQRWCPPNIGDLNYQRLHELERSLMSFKQEFDARVQDASSLANSYAHGNLDNTNIQAPSDHHQFARFYGNINNAPFLALGGSSSTTTPPYQFDGGVGTSSNPGINAPESSFAPGYFPPFYHPTADNNSGFTFPYNYGNIPSEIVGSSVDPREMQTNNVQNMSQGFTRNYGHDGHYFPN